MVDHPSSRWTHALCELCQRERDGGLPARHRLVPAVLERCCQCGTPTRSGIYARGTPELFDRCALVGTPSVFY